MKSNLFPEDKKYEYAFSTNGSYVRKDLDVSTGNKLIGVMDFLQTFSNICIYANCIKTSTNDLNKFLDQLSYKNHSGRDFANAHRLTLNMLNHFYSFTQYCESHVERFNELIAHGIYDKHFSYRLFCNM